MHYLPLANDWFLGGDIDYGSNSPGNGDGVIGGYEWVDADGDGNIDGEMV